MKPGTKEMCAGILLIGAGACLLLAEAWGSCLFLAVLAAGFLILPD